jgi:hypothetical protein
MTRKDEYIQNESVVLTKSSGFGLQPGMSAFLQGVSVTKQKGFGTFNVAAKWQRAYQGWVADEGWFILTNLENLENTINAYKKDLILKNDSEIVSPLAIILKKLRSRAIAWEVS